MKIKNPLMFYLFLALVGLNVVDYISAGFILQGEANPLFLMTKSLLLVLALKIVVLGVFGYYIIRNKYNTHFSYYLMLIIMVLTIGTVGIAAGGNVYAAMHPDVLSAAATMTTEEKMAGYTSYMMIVYLVPLLLSVLTFKLYEWSMNKADFKKKYEDIVGDVVE